MGYEVRMTGQMLATIGLCVVGWGWTLRAGVRLAHYARSPMSKRVAIGNTLVSIIPFVVVVVINWKS
ncbi:hypothetical protein U1839_21045 [Sphingomonas sp. RT2P30]|uniref:hypothetical protein n=1 Tax=Parasphingomonas halimpatiens TaxID=3096162 RepID=UPI002FCBB418